MADFLGATILAAALIELVEVQVSETIRVPFAPSLDFLIRHFGGGPVVNSANAPDVDPVGFVATTRYRYVVLGTSRLRGIVTD